MRKFSENMPEHPNSEALARRVVRRNHGEDGAASEIAPSEGSPTRSERYPVQLMSWATSPYFGAQENEDMVRCILGASKPARRMNWDAEIGNWRVEIKLSTDRTRPKWSGLLRKGKLPWHHIVLVWRRPVPAPNKDHPLDARFIFIVLRRQTVVALVGHQTNNNKNGGQFNIPAYILRGGMPRFGCRPPGREVPYLRAGRRSLQELEAFGADLAATPPKPPLMRRPRPHL